MGSMCQVCGYNKCNDALDLHHIDPTKKSFSIGSIMAKPKKWEASIAEFKKCILLCANCHREYHAGMIQLPKSYQQFNEILITSSKIRNKLYDNCPICGGSKEAQKITCSRTCAAKKSWSVDWSSINISELLKTRNMTQIGELLGISGGAVKKRMKKLGLL